ncbi:hypothetical protein C6497_12890 [Candidatus Poribacteria bacterium]|nr:MAG: hypothetical protein C6497_12890 [Candidatus Poribacteria bacterium]
MKLTDYIKKIKETSTTPPSTEARWRIQSVEIKMNQYINKCEILTLNRNNTKMRKLEILLFHIFKAVNPVQYWSESHNYIGIQCHTMCQKV